MTDYEPTEDELVLAWMTMTQVQRLGMRSGIRDERWNEPAWQALSAGKVAFMHIIEDAFGHDMWENVFDRTHGDVA